MGAKWFGASVKRKEDPAFITGRGNFVDDIQLPGMLHAVVLRSPYAHATFTTIDKSAALALPGVHAVITYHDLPESLRRQTIPLLVPSPAIKQVYMPHCLAKSEACFVGEPIAITSGGPTQTSMSVTRACGMPPVITVIMQGGRIGPPTCGTMPVTIGQTCISETRAAGGIGKNFRFKSQN